MKRGVHAAAAMWLSLAGSVAWAQAPAGHYRLTGEQDVASELVLLPDGTFEYFLMAGSLDEQAQGRWTVEGQALHLATVPRPVAPQFAAGSVSTIANAPLAIHVTTPDGHGVAAIDLTIGFDTGELVEGYTQDYGWSLPDGETRAPRWVEFAVPIYQLRSPRFPIASGKGNSFIFILTPNDMGTIDFTDMQVDIAPEGLVVHRGEARLIYEATGSAE